MYHHFWLDHNARVAEVLKYHPRDKNETREPSGPIKILRARQECTYQYKHWSSWTYTHTKKQSHYRPGQTLRVAVVWGSHIARQSAHEGGQVVSPTHGRPLPPGNIPGTHFCYRLSQLKGHSAAGRIMSMKNSNDTVGNRTIDIWTCSAVPQPTVPPRAPPTTHTYTHNTKITGEEKHVWKLNTEFLASTGALDLIKSKGERTENWLPVKQALMPQSYKNVREGKY